jgi:hypothetical protein
MHGEQFSGKNPVGQCACKLARIESVVSKVKVDDSLSRQDGTQENAIPRPFTLRVAVHRYSFEEELTGNTAERLFMARRAGMTGSLAITGGAKDIDVSDVEVL